MCLHHYENFGRNLDNGLFHKIISELSADLKKVEFCGIGEPLVNPLVHDFINQYYDKEIEICITTNGSLLNNDDLVKKIVRAKFLLYISIDGADKETYEFYRDSIKWETFIKGLECVHRNALEAGNEKRFLSVFLIVAMKKNIIQLEEFVKLAHQYGVKDIFIRELIGTDIYHKIRHQAVKDIPEILAKNYYKALELAEKLEINISLEYPLEEIIRNFPNHYHSKKEMKIRKKRINQEKNNQIVLIKDNDSGAKIGGRKCQWPWNNSYFTLDGKVVPCCYNWQEILGDINNNIWREIWNGSSYRNFRRALYSWNPNEICKRCSYELGINGGNPNLYNDYFSKFRQENLMIYSETVNFAEGFSTFQLDNNGQISHVWMYKEGKIILPMKKNARFLGINIFKLAPASKTNPGISIINNGKLEPFDNNHDIIYFPLDHVNEDILEVRLEMENVYKLETDNRPLALAIRSFV
ncbi:MAG: SPASM domain-containing protein, partial [Spirochaetes bacterium]|nr:SPASM domain-containing protein [Spirochaetota bacterium]